jgi:hypothetical protein
MVKANSSMSNGSSSMDLFRMSWHLSRREEASKRRARRQMGLDRSWPCWWVGHNVGLSMSWSTWCRERVREGCRLDSTHMYLEGISKDLPSSSSGIVYQKRLTYPKLKFHTKSILCPRALACNLKSDGANHLPLCELPVHLQLLLWLQ